MAGEKEISDFLDANFDTGEGAGTGSDTQSEVSTPQPEQREEQRTDYAQDIKAAQDEIKNADKQKQPAQPAQQAQPAQPQQRSQLRPLRGGNFTDDKGNITDANGRILARAGGEARIHTTLMQTRAQLEQAQTRLQQLENDNTTSQALNGLPKQLGLGNDDVVKALDLAAKVNGGKVLEVAREVLAMCVAQGYNVTDLLGQDVGDSIETRAIKQMIDARLEPLTRQQRAGEQNSQAMQRAQTQYDAFVSQNDYAEIHADDIALICREENVVPQQAYNKLMSFVNRYQFDPTQPLEPQINARRQAYEAQQAQQPQRAANKPMLNGGRGGTGARASDATTQMFGADDDWASIIRTVQATV